MIIGVLSDTHGNRHMMRQAADYLTKHLGAELLVHLGDNYDDAEELIYAYPEVHAVPGLWCDAYQNGSVPKTWVDELDGVVMAAAHADKDLVGPASNAAVQMVGHTHVARIDFDFGCVRLNPGHLKSARDRGQAASFATITTSDLQLDFTIHEFNGSPRTSLTALRADLKKD